MLPHVRAKKRFKFIIVLVKPNQMTYICKIFIACAKEKLKLKGHFSLIKCIFYLIKVIFIFVSSIVFSFSTLSFISHLVKFYQSLPIKHLLANLQILFLVVQGPLLMHCLYVQLLFLVFQWHFHQIFCLLKNNHQVVAAVLMARAVLLVLVQKNLVQLFVVVEEKVENKIFLFRWRWWWL